MLELKFIDSNKAPIKVTDLTAKKYTVEYIRRNADYIDWKVISEHTPIDVISTLVNDFHDDLDWHKISRRRLYEEFIYKSEKYIEWNVLNTGTYFQEFSNQFFIDFKDKIKWGMLSFSQYLSDNFIDKHRDDLIWKHLAANQKMSDSLLQRNINKIIENKLWPEISRNQKLSEHFMDTFAHFLHWKSISKFQKLSKPFIMKHLTDLRLCTVILGQPLRKDDVIEIVQTPQFEFQLREGLLIKDPEWLQFEKYLGASAEFIQKDYIEKMYNLLIKEIEK